MSDSLSILVSHNGNTETLIANTTLSHAVELWGYGDKKIAAAVNGDFVARASYTDTFLTNGDKVDIVRPVGGG